MLSGTVGYTATTAGNPKHISTSHRLLVVMPSWVGDCVMAIPMLRAVRGVCAAANKGDCIAGYMRPHLLSLFESTNVFDECIGGRPRGLFGPNREAKRLRTFEFDTALLLPNSFRAAWTTWLARTPRRIGYDRESRGWLLSDRVDCPTPGGWKEPIPLIEYYFKLVEPFGVDPAGDNAPRLAVATEEIAHVRRLLEAGGIDSTRSIALLNPGATGQAKRWPADRFAALADHLHDAQDMQIMINGSPDERGLTSEISGRVRRAKVIDLARHNTTLATLAAACSLAELIVTNDTGTRHIAVAVGFERLGRGEPAPGVVTIFGQGRPEWTTLNYPYELELFDRNAGRIETIALEQVIEACRRSSTRL